LLSQDSKKDEAIMRTFKGVVKSFREVFAELVPKGSATMKLVTSEGEVGGAVAKTGAAAKGPAVDTFLGLSIHVSFSDASESKSISALSGGQKTLVALALIFAIQRADPAPFYVFDEIDQALDPTHRAAVGALIKKQTSGEKPGDNVQFILSTFHPELLAYGDKFFGVSQPQKNTSAIEVMNKQETVAFVHAILEEERSKGTEHGAKKRRA
jgi:structural maintenance of chromosome 3 (chondroitin sulfate proteoglycan 6)